MTDLRIVHERLSALLEEAEGIVGSNYTLTLVARCRREDIEDADIVLTIEEDLKLPEASIRRFRERGGFKLFLGDECG